MDPDGAILIAMLSTAALVAIALVTAVVMYMAGRIHTIDAQIAPERISIPEEEEPDPPEAADGSGAGPEPEEWEGLAQVWRSIGERFENDPGTAVLYADLVISDLLRDRDTSHRHDGTKIEGRYRTAHEIAGRGRLEMLKPGDLDRAMGLYNRLFDELFLETAGGGRSRTMR